jgi:hypothetical protein
MYIPAGSDILLGLPSVFVGPTYVSVGWMAAASVEFLKIATI